MGFFDDIAAKWAAQAAPSLNRSRAENFAHMRQGLGMAPQFSPQTLQMIAGAIPSFNRSRSDNLAQARQAVGQPAQIAPQSLAMIAGAMPSLNRSKSENFAHMGGALGVNAATGGIGAGVGSLLGGSSGPGQGSFSDIWRARHPQGLAGGLAQGMGQAAQQLVQMKAPTGETQSVPSDQVEHYLRLGAQRIG